MTKQRVLTLMAAYNGAPFLEDQVASILSQEGVDMSLLIRIDPSTDGTEALAHRLADSDPRIAVVENQTGEAAGSAANFFATMANADASGFDAVALADQDDWWYDDRVARALEALAKEGATGYSSDVDAWNDQTGTTRPVVKSHPQRKYDYLFSSGGPGCTYVLATPLFSSFQTWLRANLETVGTMRFHDWLIYAWARANGHTWFIDPRSTVAYRQHVGNDFGANHGVGAALRRLKLMCSGWYLDQALEVANAVGADPQTLAALHRKTVADRARLVALAPHARRRPLERIPFVLAAVVGSGHETFGRDG